jgi:hypothetical protein
MFDAPEPDVVLDALGDKVVHGLSRAVVLGRKDLAEYRSTFPGWVADASERGLASWIHDRVWARLLVQVDGIDEVSIVDREPTREMYVGTRYRVRVKRHHTDGLVNTYPTQTALDFLGQGGTLPIPTLEEINLIAGYEWDREERAMGVPRLSLRTSRTNIIWSVALPEVGQQGDGGTVVRPIVPGPAGPVIGLPGIDVRRDGSKGKEPA